MLGRLARKVAAQVAAGGSREAIIQHEELSVLLGPERFFQEQVRGTLPSGVATGMAWTEAGGDVLYVEAVQIPGGRRHLKLTGQLGKVMKESARAAYSYVLSHAAELGIAASDMGVHIHVPTGAIPKDGPSAGVTITVALASLFTGRPVDAKTAMTGEMTLSGLVLPVGGIKEKVLAARRAGIRKIILPKANEHDLQKLPENVRRELEIVLVERIEEALQTAIPSLNGRQESTSRQASASTVGSITSPTSQVASKVRGRVEA
jgi:ATP-dependent Lon protease